MQPASEEFLSKYNLDPKTMTSVEAAEAMLQQDFEQQQEFDMDRLAKAAAVRELGFEFDIKMSTQWNKIYLRTRTVPYVTSYCKIAEGDVVNTADGPKIANQATLNRFQNALVKLKVRHDEAKKK